jgi:type IV pilus assembly protein PilA
MQNIRNARGFTLIELMIVVAIVAILAAIAIPAYQDYTIRSRVSECVAAAAACKTSVSEYYANFGAMPANETDAGCSTSQTSDCTAPVVDGTGNITITAQGDLAVLLGNRTSPLDLVFDPDDATGAIENWDCTLSTILPQFLPAECRP